VSSGSEDRPPDQFGQDPTDRNQPQPQPGPPEADQYPPSPGQYLPDQYPPGQYPPSPSQYPPSPGPSQHLPGQYPAGPYPPGQYPTGPVGYPPQFYAPVMARTNPFAITSLVCGIVQFLLGVLVVGSILGAIPAIVFGSIALKQIKLRGERGRGLAIAGLVLGILGVLYFTLVIIVIVFGTATSSGTS
jgi:Domain of unknown function (DUF4190)